MEPTARIKFGFVAVVIGLTAAVAVANGPLALSPTGRQTAPVSSDPNDARRQCDDLLKRTRQLMGEGNLSAANQLLTQAESLHVNYGLLRFGDTPEKVREDLNALLASAEHYEDPFTVRDGAARPAVRDTAPAAGARRAESDTLLLRARQALAVENVTEAENLARKAQRLGLDYGPKDDNPALVFQQIDRFKALEVKQLTSGHTPEYQREYSDLLINIASHLLIRKDYATAQRLAQRAVAMNVPYEDPSKSPRALLEIIQKQRRGSGDPRVLAAGTSEHDSTAAAALYRPQSDTTRNELASTSYGPAGPQFGPAPHTATPPQAARPHGPVGYGPRPSRPAAAPRTAMAPTTQPTTQPMTSQAHALFEQGMAALNKNDRATALDFFRQAEPMADQLDPATRHQLFEKLQLMAMGTASPSARAPQRNLLDSAAAEQSVVMQQYTGEVAEARHSANRIVQNDPLRAKDALAILEGMKQKVAAAELDRVAKNTLLAQLDSDIRRAQSVLDQNRFDIELNEQNEAVLAEIEAESQQTLDMQQKLKSLVEEYNQLIKEQRWAEAVTVAKRARELAPRDPITEQLVLNATMIYRTQRNMEIAAAKEAGFWGALSAVDESSTPFDERNGVMQYDRPTWEGVAERQSLSEASRRRRSPADLAIMNKLQTVMVSLSYANPVPLQAVIDDIAKFGGINVMIDAEGLQLAGVMTNDGVQIELPNALTLEDALKTILEPRGLGYIVRNGVLHITSEDLSHGQPYSKTYYVGDLVIPIPNFLPSQDMGLAGAYRQAMMNANFRGSGIYGGFGASPVAVLASHDGTPGHAKIDQGVLAQMATGMSGAGMPISGPSSVPMSTGGPGGAGGGSGADFDSVIDLITMTVKPETWRETMGGPGTIEPFEGNLSLVIRQTEDVHEEIADLLQQLRKMQDLQVTIEVRFITLNDNYFERIGVDFDFDIDTGVDRGLLLGGGTGTDGGDDNNDDDSAANNNDVQLSGGDSATVGLAAPGVFTADLDIPFTQNSFGLAVPQFGGYDITAGAQMGFAMLSDIEAYFFIAAAQGDVRSNVLQAPKVTLFNGQMASVADQSQTPFVTSTIPVVGDFAAAQQPVIMVLSEGTFLTVQAVVDDDRRYVRLTVVPFFSRIEDVDTFTFDGEETTTSESSEEEQGDQDEPNDHTVNRRAGMVTRTSRGTSVQLPSYAFLNVSTTVSVPDGGTVLLGGVKRLSEGRNEFGVPMLNKIPYVNRLFQNVSVGRETQSLMMMVTPRIIIQEEEEERLGLNTDTP